VDVRVLIVAGRPLAGQALGRALADAGLRVLDVLDDPQEAGRVAHEARPDVILVDEAAGGRWGWDVGGELARLVPGARLIALVEPSSGQPAGDRAVFHGHVRTDQGLAPAIATIRAVAAGRIVLPPIEPSGRGRGVRRRPAADGVRRLSPRERQILSLLAQGKSGRAIAEDLGLSANTVRSHVQSILAKLGVGSRLEAVAIASRRGLDRAAP
jgi:DNA-binding NarL/FixJ family response regulator